MTELENFTKKFSKEKISNVVKVGRNFFQVNEDLLKIKTKIKQEPFAIGTFLGGGNPFHPSAALLDWLDKRTEKYVIVDKKAAWLFLCGRDVFLDSILKRTTEKGIVIVRNQGGEVLGYGDMTGRQVAVRNLFDKGDFLRK